MTCRNIFLIFFILLKTYIFCEDNDNLNELLGQWYGLQTQYHEFTDTADYFTLTKTNEELFVLKFTVTTRNPYSISGTVRGILKKIEVPEHDISSYSDYVLIADDNTEYKFRIEYPRRYRTSGSLFGKPITVCSALHDPEPVGDPRFFIKKNQLIEIRIRNLESDNKSIVPTLVGYINDSGVRFRESYGLAGKFIETFNKNDKVSIIGISPTVEVIDGNYDHWYKVTTRDGKTGWVYGAYLGVLGFVDW